MGRPTLSLQERFELHVIRKEGTCWGWKGYHNNKGYPMSSVPKENLPLPAYRLSWMAHRGPIPKGILVRHKCNNCKCVNPDHLILGTHKDNHDDAVRAGTWTRGHKQGQTSLYPRNIKRIRRLRSEGWTLTEIAREYGVRNTAICNIIKGRNWAWVK